MSFDLPPEFITKYIERRFIDLSDCLASLESGDYKKIELLAHQMKGNGTSFGFPQITELGGTLEAAAREQNGVVVKESLQELKLVLESAQQKN